MRRECTGEPVDIPLMPPFHDTSSWYQDLIGRIDEFNSLHVSLLTVLSAVDCYKKPNEFISVGKLINNFDRFNCLLDRYVTG